MPHQPTLTRCSAKDHSQHIEEVAEPKTHVDYAHVDETVARKVAANVDDFMVDASILVLVELWTTYSCRRSSPKQTPQMSANVECLSKQPFACIRKQSDGLSSCLLVSSWRDTILR
jgi:hypothetical protein